MNRKKILVVDDDAVILKTLTMKLTARGYSVVTAVDGSAAVASARQEKPDIILLDVTFPLDIGSVPWDGFRIMEWLNRVNDAVRTPIIIITGSESAKFKDRALAAGAVAFFHKPIDHDALINAIRKILGEDSEDDKASGRSTTQPKAA